MKVAIIVYFTVALLSPSLNAKETHPWSMCGDVELFSELKEFEINQCDSTMCHYSSGNHITGRVAFKSLVNSSSLTVSIKAKIMHIDLNLPGLDPDVCKSPGVHCPILDKNIVTYPISVLVPFVPFEIKSVATIEIFDEKGESLICMKIPIDITRSFSHKIVQKN
uniref:NPC intracellular cholesterol transporter 2 (Trinotate prediction) n=1 Tax=Myxobolus squamalis TaxID=59785 RepID=A0A6B2G2S0_MYXSQ